MTSNLVTAVLTPEEARTLTDDIRRRVTDLLPLITRAYEQRADRALGYATWAEYCSAELSGLRVPLADRPAMVAELRQNGMSTRAIGSALGVADQTVRADLGRVREVTQLPERVTSLDGRERPAQMPARQEVADAILGEIDRQTAQPIQRPKPIPWTDEERQESERRAAITNLRSVLTYLVSTTIAPTELAHDYVPALDEFKRDDLEYAAATMTAIAALKEQ